MSSARKQLEAILHENEMALMTWSEAARIAGEAEGAGLLVTPEIEAVLDYAELFITWEAGGRRREEALTGLYAVVYAYQDSRNSKAT